MLGSLAFIGLLGRLVAQSQALSFRLGWVVLALFIHAFVLGFMYQGNTPVVYWKGIWR